MKRHFTVNLILRYIFNRQNRIFSLFVLILAIGLTSACGDEKPEMEVPPVVEPPVIDPKPKDDLSSVSDMVLIYAGGTHRNVTWNKQHLKPFVSCIDSVGVEQWLFDGFLFLEFITGDSQLPTSRIFSFGYGSLPARKQEWAALADYYFTPNNAVYALEDAIAEAVERMGVPEKKIKVVICLPQPIPAGAGSRYPSVPADYWGDINGKTINFSNKDDQIAACTWFVDYVADRFSKGNFKYIELFGFYWIDEGIGETSNILPNIADILGRRKYTFNWIPCWKNSDTPDFFTWKNHKFTDAYLQPNYFFSDLPLGRLTTACEYADKYDLDLEFEFDHNVLSAFGRTKVYRMYDYMSVFRKKGMLATKKLAYYQGTDILAQLYFSRNADDNALYREFCSFVLEHKALYKKQ